MRPNTARVRALPPVLLLAICQVGCSGEAGVGVETYQVKGRIVAEGRSMAGGMIEFRPTTAGALAAMGVINPDGTFTLDTLGHAGKQAGAPAGTYRVTILPPISQDEAGQSAAIPLTLDQEYTIEPKDGAELVIRVE